MIRTLRPERPPAWVLAAGAVVCSSLGAVTAIAYTDVIVTRAGVNHGSTGVNHGQPRAHADLPHRPCADGMVLIEGGKFLMGSDSSHPALAWARPAHSVSVDSFCLDRREISVEAFALCTARGECEAAHQQASATTAEIAASNGPSAEQSEQCNTGKPDRLQHPQNCVSFHQAARYCAAHGGRLPTEAEWEFAARGTDSRLFPWGNAQPSADHVNACGKECASWHRRAQVDGEHHAFMYDEDDGYAGSAPIGSYPLGSTPDGVLDLIGNVFEWTAGGLYSYDRSARINPVGPIDGDSHVIRGGNFNSAITEFSDPALRFAMDANSYSHGVGFRCASDPRGAAPGPSSTLEHALQSKQ
jgi:formylglycine-generating enzyme required for sulfatase activity